MRPGRKTFRLKLLSRTLVLGEHTLVMGVLNVTPDSFSNRGKFLDPVAAIEHALAMEAAGADLLDVGGESTRPGSQEVQASEELDRILPVLEGLRGHLKIPISADTRRSTVAELAVRAGAEIINDVSGLKNDPRIAEVAASCRVPIILMHMRGEPRTMQKGGFARDVLKDVLAGLRRSISIARKAGVANSQVILDPGIGFGKSFAQNYARETAATREARLSASGWDVAQRLPRRSAGSRWQARSTGGSPLGHGGDGDRSDPGRGAHRACPRCSRDGPSRACRRLPCESQPPSRPLTVKRKQFLAKRAQG